MQFTVSCEDNGFNYRFKSLRSLSRFLNIEPKKIEYNIYNTRYRDVNFFSMRKIKGIKITVHE